MGSMCDVAVWARKICDLPTHIGFPEYSPRVCVGLTASLKAFCNVGQCVHRAQGRAWVPHREDREQDRPPLRPKCGHDLRGEYYNFIQCRPQGACWRSKLDAGILLGTGQMRIILPSDSYPEAC